MLQFYNEAIGEVNRLSPQHEEEEDEWRCFKRRSWQSNGNQHRPQRFTLLCHPFFGNFRDLLPIFFWRCVRLFQHSIARIIFVIFSDTAWDFHDLWIFQKILSVNSQRFCNKVHFFFYISQPCDICNSFFKKRYYANSTDWLHIPTAPILRANDVDWPELTNLTVGAT